MRTFLLWVLLILVGAGYWTLERNTKGTIVYKNTTYGFSLDLPKSWDGYQTSEFTSNGASDICFTFNDYCVMDIIILTDSQHRQFASQYPKEASKFNFKNDKYYYSFNSLPDCSQISNIECDRTKEVAEIAKTFKFTQ